MIDGVARLRYRIRGFCARRPALFFALYRRSRKFRPFLVNDGTDVVIEGFPRSGNTYAVWAFRQENPHARIAHHMHAQAQVLRAVSRRCPVVVLIREPKSAVSSLVVRHPHISVSLALRTYVQFYEDIMPVRSQLLLAQFDRVTSEFGSVIDELNARFGSHFRRFEDSDENRKAVFARIDEANAAAYGGLRITHLPRPHEQRDSLKRAVSFAGCEQALERATSLYRALCASAENAA